MSTLALEEHVRTLLSLTRGLGEDRSGATAIEYGLLAMLVAMAIIVTVASAGQSVATLFSSVESEISQINP